MNLATTAAGPVLPPLPASLPAAPVPAPGSVVEHTAHSGLRIVAVRRPRVPVVEIRLAVPFGGADAATAELLAAVLVGGTGLRDRSGAEAVLGRAGGSLRVSVTPERLTVRGAVAADGLAPALGVLGDLLADARRPVDEVLEQRTRLGHRLSAYRARPQTAAREALLDHCFPGHPLTGEVPSPEPVAEVGAEQVAALHVRALVPRGSRLVLVGDLDPAAAVGLAEHALAAWTAPHTAAVMPDVPVPVPGVVAVARPGARQVQVRLLAAAPRADEPDHPAAHLAHLILGVSFGSRLTERLRERDGLTYSVHTSLTDHPGRGLLTLDLDTSPAQLGGALSALREELDRFAADAPPDPAETAAARGYALGSLVILLASQNGTAELLQRLPIDTAAEEWLTRQPERMERAGDAEIRAAAGAMGAARFSGIVLTAPDRTERAAQEATAAGFRPPAPAEEPESCRAARL